MPWVPEGAKVVALHWLVRCEVPLSTTQKARFAEALGSACMTWRQAR